MAIIDYDFKPVQLSPEQHRVGNAVIEALQTDNPSERKLLVVTEGFSGIGKSLTLRRYAPEISNHGGTVWDDDEWRRYYNTGFSSEDSTGNNRHVVTTAPPLITDILTGRMSRGGFSVSKMIQRGFSKPEILDFIRGTLGVKDNGLSEDALADLSLGIPGIAQQLSIPAITPETAARTTAMHVVNNIPKIGFPMTGDNLKFIEDTYLQMPFPSEVSRMIATITSLETPVRRELRDEVAPLFVAARSADLYDEMRKKIIKWNDEGESIPPIYGDAGFHGSGHQEIKIDVPLLDSQSFDKLKQSFGLEDRGWNLRESPRFRSFGAIDFKVMFNSTDHTGIQHVNWYFRNSSTQIPSYRRIPGTNSLRVEAWEHRIGGRSRENPIRVGRAVESWLQQQGIYYTAENDILPKSYIYRPDLQDIEIISP